MRKSSRERGITLAEVMIAMAGSVIVIGVLLAGSIGLQKSFHASELYANSQADERRLIDYVARDLRRAVGISTGTTAGVTTRLGAGTFVLDQDTVLTVLLPAYYKTNAAADPNFDQALSIIAAGDRVAYGTAAGPSPAFPVSFRKLFVGSEGSICIVRDEGDQHQVIIREAEDLLLQITVASDGASCALVAQFHSNYSRNQGIIAVHDLVMLRNARID